MTRRLREFLRDPRLQRFADAGIAFVLAATSVLGVLAGQPDWGRPEGLGTALALLSTVPVAWRSSYPLTAAGLAGAHHWIDRADRRLRGGRRYKRGLRPDEASAFLSGAQRAW